MEIHHEHSKYNGSVARDMWLVFLLHRFGIWMYHCSHVTGGGHLCVWLVAAAVS